MFSGRVSIYCSTSGTCLNYTQKQQVMTGLQEIHYVSCYVQANINDSIATGDGFAWSSDYVGDGHDVHLAGGCAETLIMNHIR